MIAPMLQALIPDAGGQGPSNIVRGGALHGKAFVELDLLRIWHREAISKN